MVVVIEPDDDQALSALARFDDPRLRHVMSPAKRGSGVARDTGLCGTLQSQAVNYGAGPQQNGPEDEDEEDEEEEEEQKKRGRSLAITALTVCGL